MPKKATPPPEPDETIEELAEVTTATGGSILESLDDGAGSVWRVTMVRPGVSKNRRRYRAQVLAEAAQLYEGAKSFNGHRSDDNRRGSSVKDLVGWHENVAPAADGSLQSDFHISDGAPQIKALFMEAWKKKRPDLIGFSHDVAAVTAEVVEGGLRIKDVTKITEVASVDVVADPSAGGRIERLVASTQEDQDIMSPAELKKLLAENPELADAAREELAVTPAATTTPATPPLPEPAPAPAATAVAVMDPPATSSSDPDPAFAAAMEALRPSVLREAFEAHKLPEAAQETLRQKLAQTPLSEIPQRVRETAELWDAVRAATPAQLPGQRGGRVEVGADSADKMQKALDAMMQGERQIDGVPAFRSVKEAYSAYSGRHPFALGDEDFARWMLAESVGAVPYAGERLTESLTTASWGEALGDALRKQLLREYENPDYQTWRQIVSDISNLTDFRTNHRIRVGGYDLLPTVAEGAAYAALTSPTDEEATYVPTKKGGLEDYTFEMAKNDDVGALRKIPVNLARAASLTLYRAIWNTIIAANALIYDGVALFAAGHGNDTAATPLSQAGIATLRQKMMAQIKLGETNGFIGTRPRYLVVPSALYVDAFQLAESATAVVGGVAQSSPNPWRGLEVIEVPTFTDANDWYLIADPRSIPTIEVGFLDGKQDPELLVQDQPFTGAVFTNDKITWKIRHIWGLAVLDFRGFQRATNV